MTSGADIPTTLRHLVTWGLPGGPSRPIRTADPAAVLRLIRSHRISGTVIAAIEACAIDGLTVQFTDRVKALHVDEMRTALLAEAALVETVDRLTAAGVGTRVLKGGATAHLDYPDPALRSIGDVDLLLEPGSLGSAVRSIADIADTTPATPPYRHRWLERFGKALTVRHANGAFLDLHVRLREGYFGLRMKPHDLFQRGERFELAGVALRALDGPDRLVHAAIHVADAPFSRLASVRDVAQLTLVSSVDWKSATRRAERWRVDHLVAAGVLQAWDELGLDEHPLIEWARSRRGDPVQRLARQVERVGSGQQRLSGPMTVSPWSWPAYLLPLAFPSREYLAARGRNRATHLGRITKSLVRMRGPSGGW